MRRINIGFTLLLLLTLAIGGGLGSALTHFEQQKELRAEQTNCMQAITFVRLKCEELNTLLLECAGQLDECAKMLKVEEPGP